jgi:hypothetical protein
MLAFVRYGTRDRRANIPVLSVELARLGILGKLTEDLIWSRQMPTN